MNRAKLIFNPDRKRYEVVLDNIVICWDASGNVSQLRMKVDPRKPLYYCKLAKRYAVDGFDISDKPRKGSSLKESFEVLTDYCDIICTNTDVNYNSLIAVGPAGIGKSYVVERQFKRNGVTDAKLCAGYSSAKGLYELLYKNPTRYIIFDDCDNILTDAPAVNILKSALFSANGDRVISWNVANRSLEEGMETEFTFSGKIAFLSNLDADLIGEALSSRNFCVDMHANKENIILYMWDLINTREFVFESVDQDLIIDTMKFIQDNKDEGAVNLRLLEKALKIRNHTINWRRLVLHQMRFGR